MADGCHSIARGRNGVRGSGIRRILWLAALITQLPIPVTAVMAGHTYWADMVSFFYLQLFAIAVIGGLGSLFLGSTAGSVSILLSLAANIAALWLLPPPAAPTSSGSAACVRIMTVNVLGKNRETEKLKDQIARLRPDLILVQEAQPFWRRQFEQWPDYPYLASPLIGHIWDVEILSRYPLTNVSRPVDLSGSRIKPARESLRAEVDLPDASGQMIRIAVYVVHPQTPRDIDRWEDRNDFLSVLARRLDEEPAGLPVIVGGDFNTPLWSSSLRDFAEYSGMRLASGDLLPFATRFFSGLFPSLSGTPIDHIFASSRVSVVVSSTGSPFGSDHLPVFSELCLDR